jgi:hypothetical protein
VRGMALDGEEASVPPGGRTPRLLRFIARYPRASVTTARVVIVTAYDSQERFQQSHMGSVLIWGLKRKGLDWVLHNPVKQQLDTRGFAAVLCWPYGFRETPGFLNSCVQFERRVRDNGIPVINSLAGCDLRHTWCLRLWTHSGLPCAKYQRLSPAEDLRLQYPVILRTDAIHRGLNMFFAENREEAVRILQRDIDPPLDLGLEFIDTKGPDGYYRKWRSHVIGDRVIPRQVQLTKNWKVNLHAAVASEEALEEDRKFVSEGEPHAGLVALAARVLNSEIIALDYSKKADGSYIFWEGNRNFDLSVGGEMWAQFLRSTGRSDEECVESVRIIGDAIAELILERADHR